MSVLHAVTAAVAHGARHIPGTSTMDACMRCKRTAKNDLDVAQNLMIGDIAKGLVIIIGSQALAVLLMVVI